jgi:tRNA(Ile)-lysidine synthase
VSSALEQALDPLCDSAVAGRVWVGFSGGLDSTVLLHAARSRGLSPHAIHVNHGLHADAGDWQSHCEAICARWSVPLSVEAVRVEVAGQGWEAAARRARYAVFERLIAPGDRLLLAQHQDDQVETLLLRALRGAGLEGLAGMAPQRALGAGTLCRPLLGLPRRELAAYAGKHGLSWIEDPGNASLHFDRNYLRHEVLPRIEARWPGYRRTLSRSALLLREAAAAMPVVGLGARRSAVGDAGFALADLPPEAAAAARAIRGWLRARSLQPPPAVRLREFIAQLQGSGGARLGTRDYVLERFRDAVYCHAPLPAPPPGPWALVPHRPLHIEGVGEVRVEGTAAEPSRLTVRLRRGGERLLGADGSHRSLKHRFQALAIPPWWRTRVPLLYSGDELLALGPFDRAASAEARNLALRWQPPPCPGDDESPGPSH